MPQDLLQAEDVTTVHQETHAERMPANMGVKLWHIRRLFNPLQHLLNHIASHWILVLVEEQLVLVTRVCGFPSFVGHVIDQRFLGLAADRYPALLAAFSKNDHLAAGKVDLRNLQVYQFTQPNPRIQEKHHHRKIAQVLLGILKAGI